MATAGGDPGRAGPQRRSRRAHDPRALAARRSRPDGRIPPTSSSTATTGTRSRWDEAATAVEELANGLLSLGLSKGDAFGILGRTTAEWSALRLRARLDRRRPRARSTRPARPRTPHYVLDHSEARRRRWSRTTSSCAKIARGRRDPAPAARLPLRRPRRAAREGPRVRRREPAALAEASAAIGDDDLFTYIYTSGTTGPPKACMILQPQLLRHGRQGGRRCRGSSAPRTSCCSTCRWRTTSAAACTSSRPTWASRPPSAPIRCG